RRSHPARRRAAHGAAVNSQPGDPVTPGRRWSHMIAADAVVTGGPHARRMTSRVLLHADPFAPSPDPMGRLRPDGDRVLPALFRDLRRLDERAVRARARHDQIRTDAAGEILRVPPGRYPRAVPDPVAVR